MTAPGQPGSPGGSDSRADATRASKSTQAAAFGRGTAVLDGFRGVGALLVLSTHAMTAADGLAPSLGLRFLAAAATMFALGFFALSSYLLFTPMAIALLSDRPLEPAIKFYRKRLRRVVPATWVAMLVYVIAVPNVVKPTSLLQWAAVFGLSQQWRSDWIILIIPPLWTLCNEIAFYAVLPLIARFFRRRTAHRDAQQRVNHLVGWLAAMVVVGVLIRAVYALRGRGLLASEMGKWPISFVDFFAFGMIAAVLMAARNQGVLPRWLRGLFTLSAVKWWAITAGLWWFVVQAHQSLIRGVSNGWMEVVWLSCLSFGSFTLVASMTFPSRPGRIGQTVLGSVWLGRLGMVSFGMYLWHWGVILFFDDRWPEIHELNTVIRVSIIGAASVALGAVSWMAIERPMLASSRRPGSASSRRSAAASAETRSK